MDLLIASGFRRPSRRTALAIGWQTPVTGIFHETATGARPSPCGLAMTTRRYVHLETEFPFQKHSSDASSVGSLDPYSQIVCIGSVEELERLSGVTGLTDLHRDKIDHITIPSRQGKGTLKRIEEVFDCWFESGRCVFGSRALDTSGHDADPASMTVFLACHTRKRTTPSRTRRLSKKASRQISSRRVSTRLVAGSTPSSSWELISSARRHGRTSS